MANLYEHTLTLQYIRDMVFLDPVGAPADNRPLNERLAELPKNKSFVDDKSWGDYGDDNQKPKKKNSK